MLEERWYLLLSVKETINSVWEQRRKLQRKSDILNLYLKKIKNMNTKSLI